LSLYSFRNVIAAVGFVEPAFIH